MSDPRANALDYLANHQVVTLATNGRDGLWAAAVFYASDGFELFFLSAGHTRHARNIATSPAVAATIQQDYSDWPAIQGIQLSGTAHLLAGRDQDRAIALYRDKFPFVAQPIPALVTALTRVNWYRLEPDTFYFVDNTKGFGHRDAIALS